MCLLYVPYVCGIYSVCLCTAYVLGILPPPTPPTPPPQYCSNERPDSDTEQPAGSNNPPGVGESPHPPPNTLDSAATTSHHPGTNSHVNSHMSQAASMQPGSTVGDVGEDVYDWNCMGPWVRRWVAQWVAFDEQGQEANGNLFANYCRYVGGGSVWGSVWERSRIRMA